MAIDYGIIEKNPEIKVEITAGSGESLINLRLISKKKFGRQEYIYPAKPQEIYEILEELDKRGIIDNPKHEEIKQEMIGLEAKLRRY